MKMEAGLQHCRFCAEIQHNNEFLTNFKYDDHIIKEIIDFTKNVQIDYLDILSDNSLPKTLCNGCLNNIKAFNNFLSKVKQSQIVLNNIYNITKEETNLGLEIKDEDETESNIKYELENDEDTGNDNDNDDVTLNKPNPGSFIKVELQEVVPTLRRLRRRKTNETNIKPTLKVKKGQIVSQQADDSWTGYCWTCMKCGVTFRTMDALRSHKRTEHKTCYRFRCMDCQDKIKLFNNFIDHVKRHRHILRYYCHYCNQKFDTISLCSEHTATHLVGRIACNTCGEIVKDSSALKQHKKQYRQTTLTKNRAKVVVKGETLVLESGVKASWVDYNWACQMCCQRLPDADTLRRHCQEVHNRCFAMKCMDCCMRIRNFESFVKHVRIHRPYLKYFCEYCNKNLKGNLLTRHVKTHEQVSNNVCPGCGQIFVSADMLKEHMIQNVAPRPAESLTKEDLTCNVCGRYFPLLSKLRAHKRIHNSRTRDYTCDTCGAAFMDLGNLKTHILTHSEKCHVCKICKKAFHLKRNLQEHITVHLNVKPFECNECGKAFSRKARLKCHMAVHSDIKPYDCKECGKAFRFRNDVIVHYRQHTGLRPYACEFCERTFVNFSNCNKHMWGRHGVALSKKKEKQFAVDDETKEWLHTLILKK